MRTLYVENSVGRSVTDAFNKFRREHDWEARFQHDVHPEMQQRQQEGDGWWIREVALMGFVIVSCDLAIVENDDERTAVIESDAQIVAFGQANYHRWDMMRALCRHWASIERHLNTKPAILKVMKGSKAPERLL